MFEYTHKEYQPITRILSKAFLRPEELPEKFIAWLILTNHCVETVAWMGRLCSRLLIQGNGCWDAPEGDSAASIFDYLRRAGLLVEQMRCEPHCRGLVILARGK